MHVAMTVAAALFHEWLLYNIVVVADTCKNF